METVYIYHMRAQNDLAWSSKCNTITIQKFLIIQLHYFSNVAYTLLEDLITITTQQLITK